MAKARWTQLPAAKGTVRVYNTGLRLGRQPEGLETVPGAGSQGGQGLPLGKHLQGRHMQRKVTHSSLLPPMGQLTRTGPREQPAQPGSQQQGQTVGAEALSKGPVLEGDGLTDSTPKWNA